MIQRDVTGSNIRQRCRSSLLMVLFLPSIVFATPPFAYKKLDDFKPLSAYPDIAAFEAVYQQYEQSCLDNHLGGSAAIRCFVGQSLWDRELNIYYNVLYQSLDNTGKKQLKASQRSWLQTRDKSLTFNDTLLNQHYEEAGTMYQLMQAGDTEAAFTPLIKQRALMLKYWASVKTTQ